MKQMDRFLITIACVLVAWLTTGTRARCQIDATSRLSDVPIIKAILRDIILPARALISKRDSPRVIVLLDVTLSQCPATVEAPCVSHEVYSAADREASKGTWPFELAAAFRRAAASSLTLQRFEYPGFAMATQAELQAARNNPAPMAITRPAVVGDHALVYVQFGKTYTWFVLLSAVNSDWTVSSKVLLTIS